MSYSIDKKLNKRCVGKNLEDFRLRQIAKEIKLKPSYIPNLGLYKKKLAKVIW